MSTFESATKSRVRGVDAHIVAIKAGQDVNLPIEEGGKTSLILLSEEADGEACVTLVKDYGADANLTDEGGWTALMQLAKRGQAEACFKLVELGANPNIALEVGATALMLLAESDQPDACIRLVELGANPSAATKVTFAAMVTLASKGYADVCCRAIELGADPNLSDWVGRTALRIFAQAGDAESCLRLAKLGADLNFPDPTVEYEKIPYNDGYTPLTIAACSGHGSLVIQLVEAGANPNLANKGGMTALMFLAETGDADSCVRLVELGANPNLTASRGATALHYACMGKHLELAKFLSKKMSREAALGLTSDGKTALEYWDGPQSTVEDGAAEQAEDLDRAAFEAYLGALFSDGV